MERKRIQSVDEGLLRWRALGRSGSFLERARAVLRHLGNNGWLECTAVGQDTNMPAADFALWDDRCGVPVALIVLDPQAATDDGAFQAVVAAGADVHKLATTGRSTESQLAALSDVSEVRSVARDIRSTFLNNTAQTLVSFLQDSRPQAPVAWAGSGLSCAANYREWRPLLRELLKRTGQVAPKDPDDATAEELQQYADTCKSANEPVYQEVIHDHYGRLTGSLREAYLRMVELRPIRAFLTTNFDRLLLKAVDDQHHSQAMVYPDLPVTSLLDGAPRAWYLHGLANWEGPYDQGFVLAESEFTKAYDPGQSRLPWLLQAVFLETRVIFLGCRFSESQLRECFERSKDLWTRIQANARVSPWPEHCALIQLGDSESQKGFTDLGVKPIYYPVHGETDHGDLDEILREVARILGAGSREYGEPDGRIPLQPA